MTRENKTAHRELLENAFLELRRLRQELAQVRRAQSEPIAIIGMGCRYPKGVDDPASYWRLLRDGVDAIAEIPADRWDVDAYFDDDPEAPGKMYCRVGGYLESVDRFDAPFFDIPRAEAEQMDPQHRLLLEVAWEALERAGCAGDGLAGSLTGVFMGQFMNDYAHLGLYSGNPADINAYNTLSNLRSLAAGRLAYALGVNGPAMEVDAACSSSLLAIHLACQSLRRRECDLALAGGVNLILSPQNSIGLCKLRMMSFSGRCRSFDAGADGYVRGEGCGAVVLKRLSDAQVDRDDIVAVVRGSAVNHNGRSNGLTAPHGSAQEAVIKAALADAGVAPEQVQYVETQGTGSVLGDPIEAAALHNVFSGGRARGNPLRIGSVKTNFGHQESAAGVAGFMKAALALKHRHIPPHLHFNQPNPHVPWEETALSVSAQGEPWPQADGPGLAGVSAFGMSGVNVHVVLEEAPPAAVEPATQPPSPTWRPFALSARSGTALAALKAAYLRHLKSHPELNIEDLCYSANTGRGRFEHRWVALVASTADLTAQLEANRDGASEEVGAAPSVAFLFPGENALFEGLGRAFYETQPRFRETLSRCDEVLNPLLGVAVSEILFPDAGASPLKDRPELARPALVAVQLALADLWRAWGIAPEAVAGQGPGEIAAACVAGALSLEDALRLAAADPADAGAIDARAPGVPFFSALRGEVAGTDLAERDYWATLDRRSADAGWDETVPHGMGCDLVLEIGPAAESAGQGSGESENRLPGLRPGDDAWRAALKHVATLFLRGAAIDWRELHRGEAAARMALPSYPFQRQRYWIDGEKAPTTRGSDALLVSPDNPLLLIREGAPAETLKRPGEPVAARWSHLSRDAELLAATRRLAAEHGLGFGGLGQLTGKHELFFNAAGNALIFFNRRGASLVAQGYLGPDEAYGELVEGLSRHAQNLGLELNILEIGDDRIERVRQLGFSATRVGVWQVLEDLSAFSLAGNKMRRLRYFVNRFEKENDLQIVEHALGSDADVDRELVKLAQAWAAVKGRARAIIDCFAEVVHTGLPGLNLRAFLLREADALIGVVVLAPMPAQNGYLMDMEFYPAEPPPGCMEYALVHIIAKLAAEGVSRFSLGLTMGAGLDPAPGEDPAVRAFFEELRDQGALNGDANVQFKNKFRPETAPVYLCRPRDLNAVHLADILTMLGDPTTPPPFEAAQGAPSASQAAGSPRERLIAAPPEQAGPLAVAYLRELIAAALGVEPETLPVDKPLNELRLDSLMMLELRSRIISDLGVDLPAVRFFESPMIEKLAAEALAQLQAQPQAQASPGEPSLEDALAGAQVDDLSDEEVDALLMQMMAEKGASP